MPSIKAINVKMRIRYGNKKAISCETRNHTDWDSNVDSNVTYVHVILQDVSSGARFVRIALARFGKPPRD